MSLEPPIHLLPPAQIDSIFRFWPSLILQEQHALTQQIERIDLNRLNQQIALIHEKASPLKIEPFTDYDFSGNRADQEKGLQIIREGQVGCIVMAGGQGTRLGFEGPKGLYPTSVIQHKPLFQMCFEKVLAAGKQVGRELPIAVMTSPENDRITKQFLLEQDYFGLQPHQIHFYSQGTLPFLDAEGQLFLESPYTIAEGPDGNGQCLHNFFKAGLWDVWKKQGIQYVNLILIDNSLADPFDAELLGFHHRRKVDVTVKCTEKMNPDEKVGVLVKEGGHCRVVEYSELPESEKNSVQENGHLSYCCANLSLFSFSMNFIKTVVEKHPVLPLHKAWKASKYVNAMGITSFSSTPIAWKFENFIFDLLQYTNRTAALLYPREQCFAPLKNYQGQDSISTVQEALQNRDRTVLEAITGLSPPETPFELSADFYYPTQKLLSEWKGRMPITSYVEPDNTERTVKNNGIALN